MKKISILLASLLLTGATNLMAVEEAPYKVLQKDGIFEIRVYEPYLLAETIVDGNLEEAGSKAFQRLFRYISGENRAQSKISMTAPVSQEAAGEKIAMTAPVGQEKSGEKWAVSFMMPSSFTIETLPVPNDPEVIIRPVAAHRVAAVRYSGFWSESRYRIYREKLEVWMKEKNFTPIGEPVWARYNPPFMPWFLRRNEILFTIE